MATRKIIRQKCGREDPNAYLYRFKEGSIFLRLVKIGDCFELRSPFGTDTVNVLKCKDLAEADAKAKEVLELVFDDKVEIKSI